MVSESDIRARIARVLAGDLSLDDFADWLASNSWNMHKHANRDIQQMIGAIELAFAERANGHRSDDDVKVVLRSFVTLEQVNTVAMSSQVFAYKVSQQPPAPLLRTGSSNSFSLPPSVIQSNQSVADVEDFVLAEVS